LTVGQAIEQVRVGDSGRSRLPTDDRDQFAAEWLHPRFLNWPWRPSAVLRLATNSSGSIAAGAVTNERNQKSRIWPHRGHPDGHLLGPESCPKAGFADPLTACR